MAYLLYKSNDTITPFVVVNDNTIDSTATSVFLVGKRKEAYGQPEQQSKLWMLEHFANTTPPANAVEGQAWFNTADSKLYVCVDEGAQTFEKVSNPLVAGSAPSVSLTEGNLWYDNVAGKLYVWNGTVWVLVGPQSSVPLNVEEAFYLNRITNDATPSELWLNGVTNSRLVIPQNTSWHFEIKLSARRTNGVNEVFSAIYKGTLNRDSGSASIVAGGVNSEVLSQVGLNIGVGVTADIVNNSLKMEVTGEASKIIKWNATATLTKVSN